MKDCKAVREQLALLLYGELSFDEEERIESHLDACVDCRAALKREKELHAAFDQYEATPSPSLLRDCREDLAIRLMEEAAVPRPAHDGWWDRLIDALTWRPTGALMRPVGALTLMAIGFGAARMLPASLSANAQFAGLVPGAARVRYVEPASDGKIQIVLDETRQRIVSVTGRPADQDAAADGRQGSIGSGSAGGNRGHFEHARAIGRCSGCADLFGAARSERGCADEGPGRIETVCPGA